MPVNYLRFNSVGPFDKVEFEFDKQVNVLAGPNNCGKSVTLMVLGEALVYPFTMPFKYYRGEKPSYKIEGSVGEKAKRLTGGLPITSDSEGWKSHVKFLEMIGYTTFVPALRQSTDFRAEGPGPRKKTIGDETLIATTDRLYEEYLRVKRTKRPKKPSEPELLRRESLISTEALLVKDEAVIQKMIDMDYMAYRRKERSIRKVLETISEIASEITNGFPVEFLGIGEDELGLFPKFKTPDGEIPLNCLSQGTQSIIQWLGLLLIDYAEYYNFPKDLKKKPGILIIDEIDAHLHPSWQQRIIPCLTKQFPNLQIFFSTHSPLMLAGLQVGQIHLLRREGDGKVSVTRNKEDIIGWSADQILRGFMELRSPTDFATAKNIERLQQLRGQEHLKPKETKELDQLRRSVRKNFIEGPVGAEIEQLKHLVRKMIDNKSATSEGKVDSESTRGRRVKKDGNPSKN